jgi:hypothetical protein
MVIFLVTKLGDDTLREVLAATSPGSIAVVHYADAFATRRAPHATYVFSDLDRLNPIGIARAADFYRQLTRAGSCALNDPAPSLVSHGLFRLLPSFPAKHQAGIFLLWFRELDAAGMRPCTATNKIACASSDECRGRVLRGSDRSADSGLAPNLFE